MHNCRSSTIDDRLLFQFFKLIAPSIFWIVQEYVDDFLLVKEETIKKAIFLLWDKERQVVEGAGAVSVAPIMENKSLFAGKKVVAVVSGGNIEEKLFRRILASEATEA